MQTILPCYLQTETTSIKHYQLWPTKREMRINTSTRALANSSELKICPFSTQ